MLHASYWPTKKRLPTIAGDCFVLQGRLQADEERGLAIKGNCFVSHGRLWPDKEKHAWGNRCRLLDTTHKLHCMDQADIKVVNIGNLEELEAQIREVLGI